MNIILTPKWLLFHSECVVSALEHLKYVKNLEATFDSDLKFNVHIAEKVNKA